MASTKFQANPANVGANPVVATASSATWRKYYVRVDNPQGGFEYSTLKVWTYSGKAKVATTGGWSANAMTTFTGPGRDINNPIYVRVDDHVGPEVEATASNTIVVDPPYGGGDMSAGQEMYIEAEVALSSVCNVGDSAAAGGSATMSSTPNVITIGTLEYRARTAPPMGPVTPGDGKHRVTLLPRDLAAPVARRRF